MPDPGLITLALIMGPRYQRYLVCHVLVWGKPREFCIELESKLESALAVLRTFGFIAT